MLPQHTEVLVAVNTHSLIEEVLKHRKLFPADSGMFSQLKKESGIDFVQPFLIAASVKKHFAAFILNVSDSVKLKQYIAQISHAGKMPFHLWQQSGKCYLTVGESVNLIPADSVGLYQKNHEYLESEFQQEWFKGCATESMFAAMPGFPKTTGTVRFYNRLSETESHTGAFELNIENIVVPEVTEIPDSDSLQGIALSIPGFLIGKNPLMKKTVSQLLMAGGVDSTGLFGIAGDLQFRCEALKTIPEQIISYEFDDEFNKIKKVKTNLISVPDIHVSVPARGSFWFDRLKADSVQDAGRRKVFNWFGNRIHAFKNDSAILLSADGMQPDFGKRKGNLWLFVNAKSAVKSGILPALGITFPVYPELKFIRIQRQAPVTASISIEFDTTEKSPFQCLVECIRLYTKRK